MDLSSIFTVYFVPIAAVIGLFLSIYNTYRQWKEFRRNASLDFYYLDEYYEPSLPGIIPFDGYMLNIKNLGNVNIIIDNVGCKWANQEYVREYYGNLLTEDYHNFPFKLEPGSTITIEFSRKEIQNKIIESACRGQILVSGFMKDGDGKYYTSSPVEINTEKKKK